MTATLQHYSSPYPLPAVTDAIERAAPGMGREVIQASIRSIDTQNRLMERGQAAAIQFEIRRLNVVALLTALGLIGGFLLAILNKSVYAYGLLTAELAGLVGAYYYSKRKKP